MKKETAERETDKTTGARKKERVLSLDFMRFIATVLVFSYHFVRTLDGFGISHPAMFCPIDFKNYLLGDLGVSLFFTVSGASLMATYGMGGRLNLKAYYKKRFVGLYPFFWFCYFFVMIYSLTVHPGLFNGRSLWLTPFTVLGLDGMLNGILPNFYLIGEWFLGVLILLEVIFPLLLWGYRKNKIITAFAVLLLWVIPPLFLQNTSILSERVFLFRIPDFFFGMVLINGREKIRKAGRRVKGLLLGISAILFLLFLWIDISELPRVYRLFLMTCPLMIFLFVLFESISAMPGKIATGMQKISGFSYGYFLFHHIVLTEILRFFSGTGFGWKKSAFFYFLTVALTLLLAFVAKTVYEKTFALAFQRKGKYNKQGLVSKEN